ncbi:MAG TPA: hypothetical protein VMV44_14505 [Rectinemataceae bacterium]|nr:hypothetical protein [Rectinemataceae bacterium]
MGEEGCDFYRHGGGKGGGMIGLKARLVDELEGIMKWAGRKEDESTSIKDKTYWQGYRHGIGKALAEVVK